MEPRMFYRTFGVLLLTAAWLCAYPLIHRNIPWAVAHLQEYHPLSLIWSQNSQRPQNEIPGLASPATSPSDPLSPSPAKPDSISAAPDFPLLPREAFLDSDRHYSGLENLFSFFETLDQRAEQIRIAYFGDSSIEGDLISQTFRDSLQNRFGGAGVGFVPMLPVVKNFRRSIRQSASNNWYQYRPGRKNYKGLPRGIHGGYFTAMSPWEFKPAGPADSLLHDSLSPPPVIDRNFWVNFSASPLFRGTQYFPQARLFYGSPEKLPVATSEPIGKVVLITKELRKEFPLTSASHLNSLHLPVEKTTSLRLEFSIPNNLPLYGVSIESPDGILVDNYSLRGNSGTALTEISPEMLGSFQELLDYELVILQFGLNVLNPRLKDYSWYEEYMIQIIQHLKQSMPGICILVVGIPDKSTRLEGTLRTDPSVPRITQAQRRAAFRCDVAFFSLFEAMGGEGSMIDWVEQRRLANRDYTHFNFQGANQAGNLLLQHLMKGMDEYRRKKPPGSS